MRSQHTCLHGTLIAYHGHGVLLTGESGIGKSSLAWQLLKCNYQLVADDVVIVKKYANQLFGFAPRKLRKIIHVPAIMDVPQTVSPISFQLKCNIQLICHLYRANPLLNSRAQAPKIVNHQLLGMPVPEMILPIQACLKHPNLEQMVKKWITPILEC